MRLILPCVLLLVTAPALASSALAADIGTDCAFNGLPLQGKVQVVESYGDIKVQVVESYGDLDVQLVESYADQCGEWQLVESYGDFTIQFVESYGDVTVRFVENYPGVP